MSEFKEFPKSLYKGGRTGEHRIVADSTEEGVARKDGFRMLTDPEPQPEPAAAPASAPAPEPQPVEAPQKPKAKK